MSLQVPATRHSRDQQPTRPRTRWGVLRASALPSACARGQHSLYIPTLVDAALCQQGTCDAWQTVYALECAQSGPLADFARKCKAAFHIFFPPRPKTLTPKEEGRNRLRMILVADRCAMNANSLVEMKTSIVNAVANYVEVGIPAGPLGLRWRLP